MAAVTLGEVIEFNPARCIGCGLCAGVCPTQAVVMVRKAVRQPAIPRTTTATYLRIAKARGGGRLLRLVGMVLRSVIDRAIAPR